MDFSHGLLAGLPPASPTLSSVQPASLVNLKQREEMKARPLRFQTPVPWPSPAQYHCPLLFHLCHMLDTLLCAKCSAYSHRVRTASLGTRPSAALQREQLSNLPRHPTRKWQSQGPSQLTDWELVSSNGLLAPQGKTPALYFFPAFKLLAHRPPLNSHGLMTLLSAFLFLLRLMLKQVARILHLTADNEARLLGYNSSQ